MWDRVAALENTV